MTFKELDVMYAKNQLGEDLKREHNRKLIEKYPFLLPHNRCTDKVPDDFDYSRTELDLLPPGWRIAFGLEMVDELNTLLGKYNTKYRITDIKEKYGTLRWYDSGYPSNSDKEYWYWLKRYTNMSMRYCFICGKPVKYVTRGWISFVCEDHLLFEKDKENVQTIEEYMKEAEERNEEDSDEE